MYLYIDRTPTVDDSIPCTIYILISILTYILNGRHFMGIPLMIQNADNQQIEDLKKLLHFNKKIDVIRAGLELLRKEALRLQKIKRWKHAAKLVANSSRTVNKEFQSHSRIKAE